MTPSLGLVFALFLLLPGIAFYAGLFLVPSIGRFQPGPPAPGSIFTLATVGAGALAVHALWSALLAAPALVGGAPVGRRWNTYLELRALSEPAQDVAGAEIAVFLLSLVALSLMGFWMGRLTFGLRTVQRALFGWLWPFVSELLEDGRSGGRLLAAYVLAQPAHDGVQLGYRGIVERVELDSERQIASLLLREVSRFTLTLHAGGVTTTNTSSRTVLPRLLLERSGIANIVLSVLNVAPNAAGQERPPRGTIARGLDPLARLYSPHQKPRPRR